MVAEILELPRFAYFFVLVGCNRDELGLLEDVRPKRRVRQLQDVISSHQVKSRLILVHGVQYRLQEEIRK